MPNDNDREIQTILADLRSGKLDIKLTSTAAVIKFYEKRLPLERKYCLTKNGRRQFGRYLYKLRGLVYSERRQIEQEDGVNTDKEQEVNGLMPVLAEKPEKGAIGKLKQKSDSTSGALLENIAFNYEYTYQQVTCVNTILMVQMPEGVCYKNHNGVPMGGPIRTVAVDNDDGTNTHIKILLPKSVVVSDGTTLRTILEQYRADSHSPLTGPAGDILVEELDNIVAGNIKRVSQENQINNPMVRNKYGRITD